MDRHCRRALLSNQSNFVFIGFFADRMPHRIAWIYLRLSAFDCVYRVNNSVVVL